MRLTPDSSTTIGAADSVAVMSHKHLWLLALLVCAGPGCGKKIVGPVPPAASRTLAAHPSSAPAQTDASAHDAIPDGVPDGGIAAVTRVNLIVAGNHGVKELGPDSKVVRTITRAGGHHPRFLGPDEIVMLDGASGEVTSVRRVSLVTGKIKLIARLPRLACRGRDNLALGLQSADDFGVTKDGAYACLALADRNENMADVAVSLRIDLRTGKVGLHQDLGHEKDRGEDRCQIREASGPELECSARRPESSKADIPGMNEIAGVSAFEPDGSEALSGSWIIVHGELEDADYIHRPLVLLDRRDGKAYPIRPGAWPKPLTHRELKRIAKAATEGDPDKAGTMIAVGETELRWVRLGDKDALIADGTLYIPGEHSVDLGGEVAY
jgi:hypothetical protein